MICTTVIARNGLKDVGRSGVRSGDMRYITLCIAVRSHSKKKQHRAQIYRRVQNDSGTVCNFIFFYKIFQRRRDVFFVHFFFFFFIECTSTIDPKADKMDTKTVQNSFLKTLYLSDCDFCRIIMISPDSSGGKLFITYT